jgi:TolB-like protein
VAAIAFATLGAQDAPAQDTDSPRIAVMDFTGFMLGESGNSVNIGKAVSAMLTTEFTVRDGLEVLERQDISSLLQEQRLGLSGRVDESSAVAIGKILGVQYVFHGAVVSIANSLRVDIRAIDVETSEVKSVMKMTDMTTNLLVVIVNIADAFGDDLDLPPGPPSRSVAVSTTRTRARSTTRSSSTRPLSRPIQITVTRKEPSTGCVREEHDANTDDQPLRGLVGAGDRTTRRAAGCRGSRDRVRR